MSEITDWTFVRSFLAVIRDRSLSGAARRIGLTQPTMGRHIDQLERSLGAALFTRSPSGLIPTEAALRLLPHAEAVETSMAALARSAERGPAGGGLRGAVRITASEVMGTAVLPAILAELRLEHPGIVLELSLNNRTDDLLRRDADIAVRMVRPRQQGLKARRIGEVALGLYAHERYVARFGRPERVEDIGRYHIIGFDRDDHSAKSVAAGTLPIDRTLFAFRCDHDVAQMAAVRAGLGIGVMQNILAGREASLLPVLSDSVRLKLEIWLAMHEDMRADGATRAVFDALAEGLKRHVRGGAGTNATAG